MEKIVCTVKTNYMHISFMLIDQVMVFNLSTNQQNYYMVYDWEYLNNIYIFYTFLSNCSSIFHCLSSSQALIYCSLCTGKYTMMILNSWILVTHNLFVCFWTVGGCHMQTMQTLGEESNPQPPWCKCTVLQTAPPCSPMCSLDILILSKCFPLSKQGEERCFFFL